MAQSFEDIYMQYSPLVERFAYALLKDDSAVKDISQTVFLKLLKRKDSISQIRSIKSYLFKSTKNAVLDYISINCDFIPLESYDEIADLRGMVREEDVDNRDLLMLVHLAEAKMPEQRRKVFHMSRVDGLHHKEIAAQLGISEKTVEYHISNALADIRKIIEIILIFFI